MHLIAVNFLDHRPSSNSTSKISHLTENRDWFGVQTEGNQLIIIVFMIQFFFTIYGRKNKGS